MYTDAEVTRQRRHALNILEAMQREVQNSPHHLYLDHFRAGLEDTIWVLQKRLGDEPHVEPHGEMRR